MKIAIFGGNFDPPHMGHLLIAQQVSKRLNIDHIWLLPFFNNDPISNKQRLTMTGFLQDATIKTSDFAIANKLNDPTFILKGLVSTYPQHSFYWLSGADHIKNNASIPGEYTQYQTIIYSSIQEKEAIKKELGQLFNQESISANFLILDTKDLVSMDISSSTIREKVKNSESIRGLVPKKIEEYIQKHQLYHQ